MLNVHLVEGLRECRVCGAFAAKLSGSHIVMDWHNARIESQGARLISGEPICHACAGAWANLEERLERSVGADEFLLVQLHEANQRKKKHKISGPCDAASYGGEQCTQPATHMVGLTKVCSHHKRHGFPFVFKDPDQMSFMIMSGEVSGDVAEVILGDKVRITCPDCGGMCDLEWRKDSKEQNKTET